MASIPISFEFFPPKTDSGLENLLQTVSCLAALNPEFFSVTFGAAGSEQINTPHTVYKIKSHAGMPTAPHITCISIEKEKIKQMLELYKEQGITRLVVLRGDLRDTLSPNHFHYAADLVRFIREETNTHFHITVACHPEFHPETTDLRKALFYFKEKIDAGANNAITQYFYNADAYFYFRDNCAKIGVHTPIIPGIMPIMNYEKLVAFSRACGAEIPRWLNYRLQSLQDNHVALQEYGKEIVAHLCEKLIAGGAPGLHFYTLNKAEACLKIVNLLKVTEEV